MFIPRSIVIPIAILPIMTAAPLIQSVTHRHWAASLVLISLYLALYQLAALFDLVPVILFVATGASLATLFFLGIRAWWMVAIAALVAGLSIQLSPPQLFVWVLADIATAVMGAHALSTLSLDPIFRKFRDMLSLIVVMFAVAAILPTLHYIGALLASNLYGTPPPSSGFWNSVYTAAVCSLLITVPFLLRWFAKRRFGRNVAEIVELVGVFGILAALTYFIFYAGVVRVAGVSLVYILLLPLFWIALRLRPRFVTLAFVLMGGMAVHSALLLADSASRLVATEGLLVVLAIIFYIIVSLEEDRRLNANLMRHQLLALENAVSRISSESKAKNDFIAVLAHELRNPLAPVVSGIDLLKLKTRDPEDLETLTMMEDRMQMVRRLLDDLLDISRIAEQKLRVKDEPVELDGIIRHAILSTEHYRKERHQTFAYRPADEPLVVAGDPARLEQVVSNLLTNASKYTDPGGSITMILTRTGEHARIHVRDKGIGIDPSLLEAVFTPFHQIESGKRSIKGLGIGLALVRSFVEMHGGTVEARSEGQGLGSEFVVTLPLLDAARAVEEVAQEPKPSQKRNRRFKILIVDDNDSAAYAIGKLLEIQGHTLYYAYDGGQALDRAKEKKPDVILLDLDLPDMDGYEVAKRLKKGKYEGRLIALTGLAPATARMKGVRAGFESYLLKPVGVEELKEALHKGVANNP